MSWTSVLRNALSATLAERYVLNKQLEKETKDLQNARKRLEVVKQGHAVIQETAKTTQEVVHAGIAGIVTRCLRAVFGDEFPHTFTIRFEQKRGRTEALLLLVGPDGQEVDPLDADAGGIVDVISFALRLASLLLSTPPRRKFLAVDEPFKMVSQEYRTALRDMLVAISEEFGVQVLYVTHVPELVAGEVISFD